MVFSSAILPVAILAAAFSLTPSSHVADEAALPGFEFGMSSKSVFEAARRSGLETDKQNKEKDGRKEAVFTGAMPGVPDAGKEPKTRVSFFKDRVESVTLFVSNADADDALVFERFVSGIHGAPDADKTVFSYTVKSWDTGASKVVLSHSGGGVLKLSHTHSGIRKERRERDIKRDRLKDKRHPVQRMIDGDYSKPDYIE